MNAVANSNPAIGAWQAALKEQIQHDAESQSSRETAFAQFLKLGLPTSKLDAWKYTDLRRLSLRQFKLPGRSAHHIGVAERLLPIETSQRLVFVDGIFNQELSSLDLLQGVKIQTRELIREKGRLIGFREAATQSAFALLNEALETDSALIFVDPNIIVSQPIYCAFVWTDKASNVMSHPHIAISAGRGSQVTFIEHHLGFNETANFTNVAIQVNVGENAQFLHARIQEDAPANFLIADLQTRIADHASYIHHHYVLSSGLARCDLQLQLAGVEARVELHGLLFARASEHVDVRTSIEHKSPHTNSIEDYRGIADDRGRVIFNGKVIVEKDAQKTNARQSSRNLLLSSTAEIDTRPELEIYANDVLCAHGATVGQLDAAALFYLQSRGIGLEDARSLLTHAFAAELLERLPHAATRDYVLTKLMRRLGSRVPQT